ncbi:MULTISPECIES: FAD-dependent oxidoreductase [Microcella]|uniref:FAD-dependent oxidoreductase n=2 Tax=Microcella pacifica TaxID=2591847 RepID=A0A9E5JNN7_9MICO|nr:MULTISPECIES: FAD-dependent oxidoreductase [Microcella]MBU1250798.1 FAD-dependent oxidoreductase [Actinomycetota bacterium]NHF62047.1 FAD-dependent oxidoreductase [Microcella pacifica]MBU1609817.1 FAD-dependent oxidoreductase [Actinomycetota bacterium]MBU2316327.1 FAD-dependent oxidoreductase [Actinomycetota bacterium]MBU2385220.1 FAD-dependent oxidoreductase [Actinomycetota bacterium]
MTPRAPDVIVVGAGGSGAPLAARLAERGERVLLLEAGPVPAPHSTRDGSSLAAAVPGHPLAVSYRGTLTPGRDHTVVRGLVAGGSTAINGAYFRRPRSRDLDSWAAVAADHRWSASATLPLWAEIEGDREYGHRGSGPMPITRSSLDHPLSAALLTAGVELGLPFVPDQNASPDPPPGVGALPTNTRDGQRWSTARAWLEPPTSGLTIRGGCTVTRVLFNRGGQTTGVEIVVDDAVEAIRADRVVLCAGAIATPQLLVHSGVGPPGAVRAAGATVVRDLPVGAQLHDHPQLELRFRVPTEVLDHPTETTLGVVVHGSSRCDPGTSAEDVPGDVEVLSVLRPMGRLLDSDTGDTSLSVLVSALRTEQPGQLLLDSGGIPRLDFRYLRTPGDRARLRVAARLAAALLASEPLLQIGVRPEYPSLEGGLDDDALDDWMRGRLSTALHSCGTTPMGTDPSTSVVNGRGAVHGIEGLHIADLGILPTTPTSGPAASAVLVGLVIANAL